MLLIIMSEEADLLLLFEPNAEYEIWSPFDAFEAAAVLRQMLEANQSQEQGREKCKTREDTEHTLKTGKPLKN
jgi:hypothetical protein